MKTPDAEVVEVTEVIGPDGRVMTREQFYSLHPIILKRSRG